MTHFDLSTLNSLALHVPANAQNIPCTSEAATYTSWIELTKLANNLNESDGTSHDTTTLERLQTLIPSIKQEPATAPREKTPKKKAVQLHCHPPQTLARQATRTTRVTHNTRTLQLRSKARRVRRNLKGRNGEVPIGIRPPFYHPPSVSGVVGTLDPAGRRVLLIPRRPAPETLALQRRWRRSPKRAVGALGRWPAAK